MRYLALDLGTKTCGVAISDKTNVLACPYDTVRFKSEDYEYLFTKLEEIILKENITEVIIGRPLNMDGSSGFAAKRSEVLYEKLKLLDIKISFLDERLTSVYANKILETNGFNAKKSKKMVDTLSAVLILESFLRRLDNERK